MLRRHPRGGTRRDRRQRKKTDVLCLLWRASGITATTMPAYNETARAASAYGS